MHFLKIDDLTHEQIKMVFERASRFEKGEVGRPLEGKTVALFFPSSSIRTRLSFEKAIALLGGHSVLFEPAVLDKREALADVAGYMGN